MIPNEFEPITSLSKDNRIYFIGIAGISMVGLAEIALRRGFVIAGSDMHASDRTRRLRERGCKIYAYHSRNNILAFRPDLVVRSAAVPANNPEIIAAQEAGLPLIDRSVFLGALTRQYVNVVNVAGTHGKTTTTGMLAHIMIENQIDATIHLGGQFTDFDGSSVHIGESNNLFISEACEYNRSFLHFRSSVACILNIDRDHMECFTDMADLRQSFVDFAQLTDSDGTVILPVKGLGCDGLREEISTAFLDAGLTAPRLISFGSYEDGADIGFRDLTYDRGYPVFTLIADNREIAEIRLSIPGEHNVGNAVAALACVWALNLDLAAAALAMNTFSGVEGRFTYEGVFYGAKIYSDYAHHPSAITATLKAVERLPVRKIHTVCQPLTYTRLKLLFDEYVRALQASESLLICEVYTDREQSDLGMSSQLLVEAINQNGGLAEFCTNYEDIKKRLTARCQPGDIILFLGPEEVRHYGRLLGLEQRRDA